MRPEDVWMVWVVSALFFMFILLAELDVRPLGRGGAFEVPINLSIDRFSMLSRAYLSIGSLTILGRKGPLSKSARDMLAYFAAVMKASARTVLSRTLPAWARFRSRCFRACAVAARRSHSDSADRCSPWLHRSRRSSPADR